MKHILVFQLNIRIEDFLTHTVQMKQNSFFQTLIIIMTS